MFDTIVVGIDGSPPANRAVAHAIDLAHRYDAELHVIYVVDTSRYGEPALSNVEMLLHELEEEGSDLLEEVEDRARSQSVDVSTRCCHGKPATEIVEFADQTNADVIVLGHRGVSHPESGHVGSVTERVVRHGGHPVFVV